MKKILALMLALCLMVSFAGCEEKDTPGEKVEGYEILDGGILKEMEGTNNFDKLMKKYGKITMNASGRDGNEYCVHLEENEDGYYYYTYDTTGVEYAVTPEGQYIVTSDGESQGILFPNAEEKETMQVGCVDAVRSNMYQYSPNEQVIGDAEKDGTRVVTVVMHMTNEIEGFLEFKSVWGIDDEEFDFFVEYVLDPETLEIVGNRTYCELSTGRVEIGQSTISYGQDYVISDALKECMENTQ